MWVQVPQYCIKETDDARVQIGLAYLSFGTGFASDDCNQHPDMYRIRQTSAEVDG